MKYIFSANAIDFLRAKLSWDGVLSIILENIESASDFGDVEVYWNSGNEFDLIKRKLLRASIFELDKFDHGSFWSWGKFRALYISAKKCKPDEFLVHLDLDTSICRSLEDFFKSNEMIVSGVECFEKATQSENETLYSNFSGFDCVQGAGFYPRAINLISGLAFDPQKYAYNCCIIGGRADHILRLCEEIEADSHLYHNSELESWMVSCVFEQVRIASFCIRNSIKTAILPFSPSVWRSKVTGNSKEPFIVNEENKDFKIKNVAFLGAPTHHHQGIRSSLFMIKESIARSKSATEPKISPISLHEKWVESQRVSI